MVHISPQVQGRVSWAKGGKWCKIKPTDRALSVDGAGAVGSARGRISSFSQHSRSRMIQALSQVPKGTYARGVVLITLTYPNDYPEDPAAWKRHLDNFCKALLREREGLSLFWKLEPQKRGAPHFHLLVLGIRFIRKEWVADTWYRIVGSGDVKHRKAGTRVEAPKPGDACAKYASKYASKTAQPLQDSWSWPGRWWGIRGRSNLGIEIETRDVGPWLYGEIHWAITLHKRQAWREPKGACAWVCHLPDPPLTVGGWWRIDEGELLELLGEGWSPYTDT